MKIGASAVLLILLVKIGALAVLLILLGMAMTPAYLFYQLARVIYAGMLKLDSDSFLPWRDYWSSKVG